MTIIMRRAGLGLGRRSGMVGRGGGGGGAPSSWNIAATPAAAQGIYALGSGITGTTTATGWTNLFSGGVGNLSSLAASPARTEADANYLGQPSIGFIEASSQFATWPGLAGVYKALHDGTGSTIGGTFFSADSDDTQILFATMNAAATNVGFVLRYRGASEGFGLVFGDGVDLDTINIDGVAALSVPHTVVVQLVGVHWMLWVDGTLRAEGDVDTVSSSDPGGALRLGARIPAQNEFFEGTMNAVMWVKEARGADMAALLETLV